MLSCCSSSSVALLLRSASFRAVFKAAISSSTTIGVITSYRGDEGIYVIGVITSYRGDEGIYVIGVITSYRGDEG